MDVALRRVSELGDLFEPVLQDTRPLAPAAKRLRALAG
jgi:hypothetical protein